MSATRTAKVQQQHLRLLDGLAASVRKRDSREHTSATSSGTRAPHAERSTSTSRTNTPVSSNSFISALRPSSRPSPQRPISQLRAPFRSSGHRRLLIHTFQQPELALALSSPSVGERVVRAQRTGSERFAEFLVALTADTPQGRGHLPRQYPWNARTCLPADCGPQLFAQSSAVTHSTAAAAQKGRPYSTPSFVLDHSAGT